MKLIVKLIVIDAITISHTIKHVTSFKYLFISPPFKSEVANKYDKYKLLIIIMIQIVKSIQIILDYKYISVIIKTIRIVYYRQPNCC